MVMFYSGLHCRGLMPHGGKRLMLLSQLSKQCSSKCQSCMLRKDLLTEVFTYAFS